MSEQKCRFPPDDRSKGVPLTMEFLASPALYAMGLAERRVLDVLELAYLNGAENGRLVVSGDEFERFRRCSRRQIPAALGNLAALGFVAPGEERGCYRLTYLRDRFGALPTNDWRRFNGRPVRDGRRVIAKKAAA